MKTLIKTITYFTIIYLVSTIGMQFMHNHFPTIEQKISYISGRVISITIKRANAFKSPINKDTPKNILDSVDNVVSTAKLVTSGLSNPITPKKYITYKTNDNGDRVKTSFQPNLTPSNIVAYGMDSSDATDSRGREMFCNNRYDLVERHDVNAAQDSEYPMSTQNPCYLGESE